MSDFCNLRLLIMEFRFINNDDYVTRVWVISFVNWVCYLLLINSTIIQVFVDIDQYIIVDIFTRDNMHETNYSLNFFALNIFFLAYILSRGIRDPLKRIVIFLTAFLFFGHVLTMILNSPFGVG